MWGNKFSVTGVSLKCVTTRRRRKRKKKKKKVGENNGQLRFVRHHVWRTQARLDQHLTLSKVGGRGEVRALSKHRSGLKATDGERKKEEIESES